MVCELLGGLVVHELFGLGLGLGGLCKNWMHWMHWMQALLIRISDELNLLLELLCTN